MQSNTFRISKWVNHSFIQRTLIAFSLLILGNPAFTQQKFEREVRIRERDVPESALQYIASLKFDTNIRWFKEYGKDRVSFEAKTRYRGENYSIEFSENGTFEDMEIEISAEDIPSGVNQRIQDFLYSEFGRYAIEKVQLQLSGNKELIRDQFRYRSDLLGVEVHYEIVISTRLEGSFVMFEFLFSETGRYVSRARIVEKSTDNIIY